MQRLGLGYVLQHGVVLHGAFVDAQVDAQPPDLLADVDDTLLLAAHHRAAGTAGHEHRLDPEGIARAEQLLLDAVPQRESEHAAQLGQRVGAPVVVGRDDRLAVAVGGELRAVLAAQRLPQLEVVVDLTVEHQHIAVGRLRRPPAQRLVGMGDVDDREPVEAQYDPRVVAPGARLVRTAVAHQGGGAGNRVDGRGGRETLSAGICHQSQQTAHRASMPNPVDPPGIGTRRSTHATSMPGRFGVLWRGGLRCVVFKCSRGTARRSTDF